MGEKWTNSSGNVLLKIGESKNKSIIESIIILAVIN